MSGNLTHDELTLSPDAASSSPQRGTGPVYTRVYRRGGRVAHILEAVIGTGCEREEEDHAIWRGTGSQREYDLAAKKPLCPKCFRWRESAVSDPRLGSGHGTEMT
jgi:hypothetical protein